MKNYVWVVPVSAMLFYAHLVENVKKGMVPRLCNGLLVNVDEAIVVDSEKYSRRCAYCQRVFNRLEGGSIAHRMRPVITTPRGVQRVGRRMWPTWTARNTASRERYE